MDQAVVVKNEVSRSKVLDDWRQMLRIPAPKNLSKDLMSSILAWERQVKTLGGMPADLQRALKTFDKPHKTIPSMDLKPGVTLVREWNGRTYQVNVLDRGFEMDGKDYKSLSALARKITGAKWSGPRFFGLNTKKAIKHA